MNKAINLSAMFVFFVFSNLGSAQVTVPVMMMHSLDDLERRNEEDGRVTQRISGDAVGLIRVEWPTGTMTTPHNHANELIVFLVEGRLRALSGDNEFILVPGDNYVSPSSFDLLKNYDGEALLSGQADRWSKWGEIEVKGGRTCITFDNPDAYGIQRAKNHSIDYKIIDNNRFKTREDFDRALVEELEDSKPDLVVLAGFMRILTPVMIEAFKNRIINIHPSLLPKYPGLDTHNSVMNNGDLKHGVTIHFVNEVLDGGQIIAQGEISVNNDETLEELKTRIHAIEHVMLPMVVSKFADGTINKEKVIYEKF